MSSTQYYGVPTAEATQSALVAAYAEANTLGLKVNIALVDVGGNLTGFLRVPGAFLSSIDLAIDKAYTSASFGLPTRAFGEHLASADRATREGLLRRLRLTEVPGGYPIIANDVLIGGIGVSGATADQDEIVATAGLRVFV